MFVDLFQRLGHDEHVQDLDFVFCGPNIPPHLHGTRHTLVHHHAPAAATKDQTICGLDGVWQESPAATPGMMTTRCCDSPPSTAGALTVRLWYNSGLYHDVSGLFATPDALFLFNAGLWGYDDWEPTLEHILGCDRAACPSDHVGNRQASPPPIPATKSGPRNAVPVVVTSYCSEEASDDMETLERVLLGEDGNFVELSPGVASSPVGGLEWLWKPEVNPHRSRVPRRTECGVEGRALFENHSWQALRPLRCRHFSKATCNEGLT
ncbi:conserved unknown protein [Ectocarpus siliculosus]|uniref:Mitochondrial splicing suppressor 51-like C-terminal domain-containing protein n=1 Tax=Ectocarpus siliculosus TaxID=2880 RepID=D7FNZ1_ECTSI|nr:conserved unknown protein [Ectocarpus siliculosus]|eukprot:CBJ30260.1 conserved unknown protein [Ectocarpus siliculosus]